MNHIPQRTIYQQEVDDISFIFHLEHFAIIMCYFRKYNVADTSSLAIVLNSDQKKYHANI